MKNILVVMNLQNGLINTPEKTALSQKIIENAYGAEDKDEAISFAEKQIFDIDLNASNLYNTIISNINNNDLKKGTLFV